MDSKLIDLEARSMRDNLMFYGIPEGGDHENCEMLVKELCETTLGMDQAYNLKFDRMHRVGTKAAAKVRPRFRGKGHYTSASIHSCVMNKLNDKLLNCNLWSIQTVQ